MTQHPHSPYDATSSTSPREPLHAITLLEQVDELDAFERDLASQPIATPALRFHPTSVRVSSGSTTSRRWWMSLGGLAVAASLLVIVMASKFQPLEGTAPTPTPLSPDVSINTTIAGGDLSQPTDPHATVLLTIVEGSDPATGLPCAACRTVDLLATDGREQTLLAHAEPSVIQDAMNRTCSPGARRVVVVGLSGPSRALPSTEAQATQLAQCIMTAPGASSPGGDATVISNAASACMPDSVSVRVWAASR
jgi:hypothetical protein